MARTYKVKIGDIWLTNDGTEDGLPCKVEVPNAAILLETDIGNVAIGADGVPFREMPLTPTGAGRPFAVLVKFMTKAVYDALKAALDTAASSSAEFQVTGTGTPGDFDVNAIVFDNPVYINFGSFSGNNLKDVIVSFVTTAIN